MEHYSLLENRDKADFNAVFQSDQVEIDVLEEEGIVYRQHIYRSKTVREQTPGIGVDFPEYLRESRRGLIERQLDRFRVTTDDITCEVKHVSSIVDL